jgi:K+-transporting ATPase ATPase B chain
MARNKSKSTAVWQGKIVRRAILDSFVKLDPRHMMGNPVMFVVEVGSVITTVLLFRGGAAFKFNLQITLWLWFTVLFANFAEAMAEGRGKAQADTLRKARSETIANRIVDGDRTEQVQSSKLRAGDVVLVSAGEFVPSDGEIIYGVASVDESAITGESAPVIRESGGDRSAVTGGTRVLSDQIKVKVTSNPGETFLDRMIALVEGAERQKTPNEIALNILLAGLTIIFLLAVVTLQPFAIYSGSPQTVFVLVSLLVCLIPTTIGGLAVRDRDRRHGPHDPAQCAGDVRTRRRGCRRCRRAAARQDRDHHARQPPGVLIHPAPGVSLDRNGRRCAALVARGRNARGPLASLCWRRRNSGLRERDVHAKCEFVPFTAQTRMSGVNMKGQIRKGAADPSRPTARQGRRVSR